MIFRMEYPQMKCLLVQFIQPRNADGVNFKSFVSYDLSVFEFREGFNLTMRKDSLIPVSVVNYAHMRYPKPFLKR